MTRLLRLRLAAASLFSVSTVLCAGLDGPPTDHVGWVLLGAPFVAGALLWVPRLEAQLLTRAILWAFLFWASFGSLIVDGGANGSRILLSVGLGSAGALFLLPPEGLEHTAISKRFVPVGFRSVLVLILILAMTDTLVLATNFLGDAETRWNPAPWRMAFFGGGSLSMAAAVVGLLRMRAWGFGLNLVTNVAVASLAWVVDDLPWELALGLTITAVLQILVGLPLARRIVRPGARDPSEAYRRFGRAGLGLLVLVLVGSRLARIL